MRVWWISHRLLAQLRLGNRKAKLTQELVLPWSSVSHGPLAQVVEGGAKDELTQAPMLLRPGSHRLLVQLPLANRKDKPLEAAVPLGATSTRIQLVACPASVRDVGLNCIGSRQLVFKGEMVCPTKKEAHAATALKVLAFLEATSEEVLALIRSSRGNRTSRGPPSAPLMQSQGRGAVAGNSNAHSPRSATNTQSGMGAASRLRQSQLLLVSNLAQYLGRLLLARPAAILPPRMRFCRVLRWERAFFSKRLLIAADPALRTEGILTQSAAVASHPAPRTVPINTNPRIAGRLTTIPPRAVILDKGKVEEGNCSPSAHNMMLSGCADIATEPLSVKHFDWVTNPVQI
ncbi:hypothetical protein VTJ04DRAFT_1879 [Mycothermus thermophilus]|uniref:uncharacterized protein n=1 Tax=Humicola insolens TaxID=85995 RepID=UPI0037431BEC